LAFIYPDGAVFDAKAITVPAGVVPPLFVNIPVNVAIIYSLPFY
jgi:hypothetical protein